MIGLKREWHILLSITIILLAYKMHEKYTKSYCAVKATVSLTDFMFKVSFANMH